MKVVAKLFADLVAWRWTPAAALLAASTLFVIVVVGLVPTEIGVPVASAKVTPKSSPASTETSETTTASFASPPGEANPTTDSQPVAPRLAGPAEFGRRGFSPRLDRPDPPAAAPPPPQPVVINPPPVPAPGGPIGGIFSRIQGALRPASQAAAAATLASANVAAAATAETPAPNAPPSRPAVTDGTAPEAPGGSPAPTPSAVPTYSPPPIH